MPELEAASVIELLRLQAGVLDELRRRGVVRSSNSPIGDYAELLFSRAFDWRLEKNSSSGYDATDSSGARYQIKCRRLTSRNPSRQMSALRRLDQRPFDVLAALLLNEDFSILRAALIPIDIVKAQSVFTPHVNAHRFMFRESIWSIRDVEDVTDAMKRASALA